MIFFRFSKKLGFRLFLVHPTVVSVLLSASVERCFVSRMRDFLGGVLTTIPLPAKVIICLIPPPPCHQQIAFVENNKLRTTKIPFQISSIFCLTGRLGKIWSSATIITRGYVGHLLEHAESIFLQSRSLRDLMLPGVFC